MSLSQACQRWSLPATCGYYTRLWLPRQRHHIQRRQTGDVPLCLGATGEQVLPNSCQHLMLKPALLCLDGHFLDTIEKLILRSVWALFFQSLARYTRQRRRGRVVEGAPLLREYTGNGIEGSNPFVSATYCVAAIIYYYQ